MSQIPITKKDKFSPQEIAKGLEISPRGEQAKRELQQPSRKWLFLSLVIFLIIIGSGLNYYFSISQKHAFADLIPENALAHLLINQIDIYPQVVPFSQEMINKFNQYFDQAGLSFSQDIQSLFKNQAIFILLPSNSETALPFLVILEKNQGLAKTSQILDKLKPELNKDFNLSSQNYRQIEVIILKSIDSSLNQYFYAQAEKYFIITNSQEELNKILDFIINS